jgi:hypothetical protein
MNAVAVVVTPLGQEERWINVLWRHPDSAADSEASYIFYCTSRKSGHNIAGGVHNSMLPRCQFYMILDQRIDGVKKEQP